MFKKIEFSKGYIKVEYQTKEEAVKARKEAEEKYFGEYSYDNSQEKYYNLLEYPHIKE